jgi:carbon-monoxide dehydrogenase small subunit
MMLAAIDLLNEDPDPSEDAIRHGLEGNLCRCTGYQNIVQAVRSAAMTMGAARPEAAEQVRAEVTP